MSDTPADLLDRLSSGAPDFIADPYPTLNALREAGPIWWNEHTGQWMVTRFDDVTSALRDRRLGRNYTHLFSHEQFGNPEPDPRWAKFHEHEQWSLLSLEPPDHTRLRALVAKVFTPRSVARLGEQIEQVSNQLLDRCAEQCAQRSAEQGSAEQGSAEQGSFDLLADYAQPYSVAVICSMLGVPRTDTELLLDWSHAIVKMYELSATDEVKAAADRAAGEYIDYTKQLLAEKRRKPDGLLLSELVRVEEGGQTLTEAEIVSTAMVLVEAGHEATVNTLGNGFRALMHHRDQWQRLTSGEVYAEAAVEELLRWDSPLQLFERWVLEPGVEIGGQELAVGEKIAMLFGSAQRDPRRFEHADQFDIGRNEPTLVGFGGGLHYCIGAPLARAELSRSVKGLVERFPDLQLVEEPTYHPTFVIRGLSELRLSVS